MVAPRNLASAAHYAHAPTTVRLADPSHWKVLCLHQVNCYALVQSTSERQLFPLLTSGSCSALRRYLGPLCTSRQPSRPSDVFRSSCGLCHGPSPRAWPCQVIHRSGPHHVGTGLPAAHVSPAFLVYAMRSQIPSHGRRSETLTCPAKFGRGHAARPGARLEHGLAVSVGRCT